MKKTTAKKVGSKKAKSSVMSAKDIERVLGECHDGDDLKLLMKDETVKIVPREDVPKTLLEDDSSE